MILRVDYAQVGRMIMKKIGFIGAGNMATAIIKGLISANQTAENLCVYDVDAQKLELMTELGVAALGSGNEVVENSDIIVLAVKPQSYAQVLEPLGKSVDMSKVFVSIAAGISIKYVRSALGVDCPVVRVMPNTPLLLKKGATALCPSENISEDDKQTVYEMFANSGVCEFLTEDKMNTVIAVNGSSPAYIYLFAKTMADYAQSVGIDYDAAMNLICATLEGSAAMLKESGDAPETLIEKVSSKGGTTIAALDKLRELGFTDSVTQAMQACTQRAEELGK